MGQTRYEFETGITQLGNFFGKLETDLQTIESNYSGTSFPAAPQTGQHCFRTDRGDDGLEYIYTGNPAVGESGWVDNSTVTAIGLEIILARGSKPTLDQRLDVAFNEDGTPKAGTSLNPSQWTTPSLTFTYVDGDEFTVNGDQTDIYLATRRLKINFTVDPPVYSEVVSATYSAGPDTTDVTILDSVLDATLVSVEHSIVTPVGANSALSAAMLGMYTPPGSKTTMTGNLTFTDHGNALMAVFLLDPNGAARTFTPAGTFRERVPFRVKNIGTEYNLYAGALSNIVIAPGETADIYYDGTTWNRF